MFLGMEFITQVVIMKSKYNFDINDKIINEDINRLTNQLWKLIPMRENKEDWKSQLDTVVNELAGMNEILNINGDFLVLLSKLEGLRISDTTFSLYRKTIFECISLLREIYNG